MVGTATLRTISALLSRRLFRLLAAVWRVALRRELRRIESVNTPFKLSVRWSSNDLFSSSLRQYSLLVRCMSYSTRRIRRFAEVWTQIVWEGPLNFFKDETDGRTDDFCQGMSEDIGRHRVQAFTQVHIIDWRTSSNLFITVLATLDLLLSCILAIANSAISVTSIFVTTPRSSNSVTILLQGSADSVPRWNQISSFCSHFP